MQYYATITASYAPKNALHKALLKLASEVDGLLIDDLPVVEKRVMTKGESVCNQFPRCHRVVIEMSRAFKSSKADCDNYHMDFGAVCQLTFYLVRGYVNEDGELALQDLPIDFKQPTT